jgi:hypothetical protein
MITDSPRGSGGPAASRGCRRARMRVDSRMPTTEVMAPTRSGRWHEVTYHQMCGSFRLTRISPVCDTCWRPRNPRSAAPRPAAAGRELLDRAQEPRLADGLGTPIAATVTVWMSVSALAPCAGRQRCRTPAAVSKRRLRWLDDRPSCDAHSRQVSGGVEYSTPAARPPRRGPASATMSPLISARAPGLCEAQFADDVGGETFPDAAGSRVVPTGIHR